jgi:hypothetical protein
MSITYIQSNGNCSSSTSTTTESAAFASNNTLGNAIIVACGGTGSSYTLSVSDSAGNSYTPVTTQTGTSLGVQIFWCSSCKAGSNTVTVTASTSITYLYVACHEYSGLAGTVDQTLSATGSSGTLMSVGPVTTTHANELLFCAAMPGSGISAAGSGYTLRQSASMSGDAGTEDQLVATIGSYSATMLQSPSNSWTIQLATFPAAVIMTAGGTTGSQIGTQQASFSPQAQYDGTGHVALKTIASNTDDLLAQLVLEMRALRKALTHLALEGRSAVETDFYTDQGELII